MTLLKKLMAACLCLSWIFPAASQTPYVPDGKAVIPSKSYLPKYAEAIKNPNFVHDEAAIRFLVKGFLSNHVLDADEKDVLQELARDDVSHVSLTFKDETYRRPVADNGGKRIIELVVNPVDMEALWASGDAGIAALVEMFGFSAAHKNHIQKFVASKLQPHWQGSNINNQYDPIRKALGLAHKGAAERGDIAVCEMYYESMKYLDAVYKSHIPDHIYGWLKPAIHDHMEK